MSRFRYFLKNKNFSLLWVGQVISQFGDRLTQMALIALIFKMAPGSTLGLAKTLAITIIPVFLIGPIAGVYVDRWDRRKTMFTCDFIRAFLIFLIPFFFMHRGSLVPIYIIIFLVFCFSRFFVPAKMSLIPDLVQKEDLLLANSLVNITGMVAAAFGFGIGGIIVEMAGARGGFYLNSLTFLISGILIFFVSSKISFRVVTKEVLNVGKEIAEVIRKSIIEEVKDVIVFLGKKEKVGYILNLLFLLGAALGSVSVVFIVFIQKLFSSAVKELGILAVCLGVGLFLGSIFYGRFGKVLPYLKAIFISLTLSGIVLVAFILISTYYVNFVFACMLSLILGVVFSPVMIASFTIVHELTNSEMLGKVFSGLEIIMHLAFLIFMFLASFLAEKIGQIPILIGVGVILIIFGIVEFIRKKDVKII